MPGLAARAAAIAAGAAPPSRVVHEGAYRRPSRGAALHDDPFLGLSCLLPQSETGRSQGSTARLGMRQTLLDHVLEGLEGPGLDGDAGLFGADHLLLIR